jgi:hypothetical protein
MTEWDIIGTTSKPQKLHVYVNSLPYSLLQKQPRQYKTIKWSHQQHISIISMPGPLMLCHLYLMPFSCVLHVFWCSLMLSNAAIILFSEHVSRHPPTERPEELPKGNTAQVLDEGNPSWGSPGGDMGPSGTKKATTSLSCWHMHRSMVWFRNVHTQVGTEGSRLTKPGELFANKLWPS